MKIIFEGDRKDICDYAIHTQAWGDFKAIYGNYHPHIPKINWNGTNTVFNWPYLSDNFIKRWNVNDIYSNGATFTFKDKKYEIPKGAYLTYDNNLQLQVCYQNKVCTVDGLVFDKIELKKNGLYKTDEDSYFQSLHNPHYGFYQLIGYLLDSVQDTGLVSKIEYGTIQKHIYEPQTVKIKDVDGQCIFVASGVVNLEWQEDNETISRNFEAGTLIMLSDKEIKVTDGNGYQVYELYAVKDKTALYDLYNNK